MKKRLLPLFLVMCLLSTLILSACGSKMEDLLDPDDPITVIFWHSYKNLARTMLENN